MASSHKFIALCFCLLVASSGIVVEAGQGMMGLFGGGGHHGGGHGALEALLAAGLLALFLNDHHHHHIHRRSAHYPLPYANAHHNLENFH